VELTTFVGRGRELQDLEALLERSRLLTLTGAGGSGKTRLAAALSLRVSEGTPHRAIVWVELAPVKDARLVAAAVAEALGDPDYVRSPDAASLARFLGDRDLLLVLDNCEHLVEAVAELADSLLRSCPALRVLATSREPLAVQGERSWLVPALGLPSSDTLEGVGASESVRLFVERARDVAPDFTVTAENTLAVADICRRLDGIPLAIELAAARVRVLTPGQIRDRLDDAFQILSSPSRTSIARHRTLRAAMDWSYDLLLDDARALFRRLAVFRGSATLDAIEAIGSGGPVPPHEILDTLARLVDRSLVTVREHQGAARYALLETVRQYAAEKLLETEEHDDVQERHARYFVGAALEADPHLLSSGRAHWIHRLLPDIDNFRGALAWTRAHDPRAHVRMVGSLRWFWYSTGHWTEANQWTAAALALPEAAEPGRDRAALLFASGFLLSLQARPLEARPHLEECVELAREAGDLRLEAYGLTYLGMVHGQVASQEGVEPCRRAASWFEANGDLYGHRLCRLLLGTMALHRGDLDEALSENEEGIRLAQRFGMPRELGISLQNAGMVHLHRGELDRAEARVRESLEELRRDPSHFFIATSLDYLGEILGREGRAVEAARVLGAAEALREAVGAARFPINERRLMAELPAFEAAAGVEAWTAAWRDGRALAPDRVHEAVPAPVARPDPGTPPRSFAEAIPRVHTRDPLIDETPDLDVRALGPFEAQVRGEAYDPDRWSWAKPKEALVLLLLHPEGVTRDRLGSALWPDSPPTRMKNSFHVALHHLRKSLGRPEWIVLEADRYRLAPQIRFRLDVSAFERAVRQSGEDPDRLRSALALWRGELLEDEAPGPWVEEHRDRLRRLHVETWLALGACLDREERRDEAADCYRRALRLDELREDAHRRLMAAWAASGQRARALQHYDELFELLRDELQASPEPATIALYESLRSPGEARML
jgi:predicted ATPase/DNA-binding SARP family transcriptional activator